MGESSPAFSFYARDFMVGSMAMTLEQRGAYITLLCYQWDAGSVPDDLAAIARILGCAPARAKALWSVLSCKFVLDPDGYRNRRLEVERSKQAERREQLAANGRKGGRPPKPNDNQKVKQNETNRFSVAKANGNLNESLSSSSSFAEVQEPPIPPSSEGGDALRPVTRKEREWADALYATLDGCPHSEPCRSEYFCRGRLIEERRADELSGRKVGAA